MQKKPCKLIRGNFGNRVAKRPPWEFSVAQSQGHGNEERSPFH